MMAISRTRAGARRYFKGWRGRRVGRAATAALLVLGLAPFTVGTAGAQATNPWVQIGSDIDGEAAGDFLGSSVSLSSNGTRLAVGATGGGGTVRVYELLSGSWTQVGSDIDGDSPGDVFGWSVSLSADGNTVAIGAPNNDVNGSLAGLVRVFVLVNGSWVQTGEDIYGEAAFDQSGYSVSLSAAGDVVALGAPNNDGNGSNSGATRVFGLSGGAWTQVGTTIEGEVEGDQSGYSVSLSASGGRVALGAPFNDGNGPNSGATRVFGLSNGAWTQIGTTIEGSAQNDRSGSSLFLSATGDRVAIGAPFDDANGGDAGSVQVLELVGGSWTQVGSDIDGEAKGDRSGEAVALSAEGDRLIVGARYSNGNGTNSGHARVYDLRSGSWVQVGADIDGEAAGDLSGWSVSISGDGTLAAVGAIVNGGNGGSSGHVRVFSEPPMCDGLDVTVDLGAGESPTTGDDVILGTSGDDVIDAQGGDDVVCAGDGEDLVIGGDGDDTIFGGPGSDTISGNAGADQLFGEGGPDSIFGGSGPDTVDGGIGNDRALGGSSGADTVLGGDGRDTLSGGSDDDVLVSGGDGDDAVNGGGGNDNDVRGDAGDDTVSGNGGQDTVSGGDGDDEVRGGQNDDQVFGDGGDDFLAGNAGDDTCDGGTTAETNGDTAASNCETIVNVP